MSISVGEAIDIPIEIYDVDGDLADPTTLRAIVRAPDGTQTVSTYAGADWVRTAAGEYIFSTPTFDQVGDWWVAFEMTGPGTTKVCEHKYPVCGLHVSLVPA